MKKILTKKNFSYLCPLNRDDFEVVEGGHYCETCSQKVFDVSDCSIEEIMALQKKHSNLCVSFKSTILATTLALSMASCENSNLPIDPPLMGEITPFETNITIPPKQMFMGKIACPPKNEDKEKINDK